MNPPPPPPAKQPPPPPPNPPPPAMMVPEFVTQPFPPLAPCTKARPVTSR